MQNSRGQNPCLMAAYAQGACEPDGGAYGFLTKVARVLTRCVRRG